MLTIDERMRAALTAEGEALWKMVRDPHRDVISNTVLNRNFTEDMAVFIAKKKTAASETLSFLANDVRFKDSYKLKNMICRNPVTPQRITLSLLKFLRIFDLADMTKDQRININVRKKIEFLLLEKMPSMPSGVKIALAKRANDNTLLALIERGDEKVIAACLESPVLTEAHLYKVINKAATKAAVITMISGQTKWSSRYYVKFALIRNCHTPMNAVLRFIKAMRTTDLKELYSDQKIPTTTKPFIYSELLDRKETTEIQKEQTYSLSWDEDTQMPTMGDDA
jgi:hypothetical protein